MATNKRRRSIKLLTCPGCSAVGTLRKIVYGMPDPETFDFEKFAVGGCCMNGDGSILTFLVERATGQGFVISSLSIECLGAETRVIVSCAR